MAGGITVANADTKVPSDAGTASNTAALRRSSMRYSFPYTLRVTATVTDRFKDEP
jgi:hypothetical protein